MGQAECYEVLKKAKKPLSAKEIAKKSGQSKELTRRALATMYKFKEVHRDIARNEIGGIHYLWSIR